MKRITSELPSELISVHAQCPVMKCGLRVFSRPLAWEINQAMGVANDEDNAFRRHDPMCAAKPLRQCHEELE